MKNNIVDWKTITSFVIDAFVGYGIPREDAEICADVLLESDKRGIESHGVNRFKPVYLDRIKAGIQNAVTEIEILKETPTTAVIDGHHGMGQVIGHKAMSMAIAKAKEYGMGMVVAQLLPLWYCGLLFYNGYKGRLHWYDRYKRTSFGCAHTWC